MIARVARVILLCHAAAYAQERTKNAFGVFEQRPHQPTELRVTGPLVYLIPGRAVIGPVAVGTPVPLVCTGRRIEDDHTAGAVAVCDEHFAGALDPAAGYPHVVQVVNVNAVFVIFQRPLVSVTRAIPALQQLARRIELHHHRRCFTARLPLRHHAGAMNDPHIVLRIRGDTGAHAENPGLGNLGPVGIDLQQPFVISRRLQAGCLPCTPQQKHDDAHVKQVPCGAIEKRGTV